MLELDSNGAIVPSEGEVGVRRARQCMVYSRGRLGQDGWRHGTFRHI